MLAKRYGGRGRRALRAGSEVSSPVMVEEEKWGRGLTAVRSTFSIAKVYVSLGSLIRPNHSSAMLALSCPTPLCQAPEQWPHQILKGGRKLLCANLADPVPTDAARGCGAAPGLSSGHGPLRAAHGRGFAAAAAPGLLAGHRPLHAARGHGLTTTAAPGLLARHGPLRATHGRVPLLLPSCMS